MRAVIYSFWHKVIRIERRVQGVAAREAGAIMHAAEQAAATAENMTVHQLSAMTGMAQRFLRLGAAGGIVLMMTTLLALIVANSPLYEFYDHFFNGVYFRIGFDDAEGPFDYEIRKSLLLWINDGLMVIFFFLVGLEIKREIVEGELSTRTRALLPVLAAAGGMAAPALIYLFINAGNPATMQGWAIPAATDIAFALGILMLLGRRVPVSLKILLTAIAILDDLGAILIIAIFYTPDIHVNALYAAALAVLMLIWLNARGVTANSPYMVTGLIMWMGFLESGVHATLSGVLTALFIPVRDPKDPHNSPVREIEHTLHPWVAFFVLPAFAFANAGVPFKGIGPESFTEPLTLGIILGLVLGKQLGIFSALFLAIKSGLTPMPAGTNWVQLYAVSLLCGIGFTMSLFIGGLAFTDLEQQAQVRLGVLSGSALSALAGFLILYFCCGEKEAVVKN